MEGKSGHLVMRYTYKNTSEEENGTYVPFLMATGMLLDEEVFSNVSVINGKLISDGSKNMAIGLGMPNMQEKLGTEMCIRDREHPDEENVEFQYTLQYNDSDTGKMARFSLQKPEIQPAQARFVKTRGIYEQSGDLGQGNILYNIFLGTELNRMNEFVIYDTPDVNIGFDGNMKVYIPTNYGNLDNVVLQNGNYYAEPGNMDDESKMEIYIYDLYYLTEEANAVSMPRQAGYTEEYVTFSRRDITTGADSIKSMEAVTCLLYTSRHAYVTAGLPGTDHTRNRRRSRGIRKYYLKMIKGGFYESGKVKR